MAALVSHRMWQRSPLMRPHPISVPEHVLSASGSAGRLGQDQLGNRQCGCRELGWATAYHWYCVSVKTFSMLSRGWEHLQQ